MANFVKLAATAQRLIDKNGRTATIVKQGSTPVDATKPWRGQDTTHLAQVTGKAVFVEPSKRVANVDQTKRAEQVAYFAANGDAGQALETFDLIVDGSVIWKILRAELLRPADKKLLYIFEVSR